MECERLSRQGYTKAETQSKQAKLEETRTVVCLLWPRKKRKVPSSSSHSNSWCDQVYGLLLLVSIGWVCKWACTIAAPWCINFKTMQRFPLKIWATANNVSQTITKSPCHLEVNRYNCKVNKLKMHSNSDHTMLLPSFFYRNFDMLWLSLYKQKKILWASKRFATSATATADHNLERKKFLP